MSSPSQRSDSAGGFVLAVSLMIGTIIGLVAGQPSLGFLAGLVVGAAIAVMIWLKGRR
ncbi:hypothetical protein [Sphingomonas dokdonensis]|uniref:Uncharacterized protein n=1 Tax=Sphingomonas dokdonensis TaxID=344880 RepID=A0A245ZNX7_9SPHN|nr:hypothetical protein [Sphingomonas dokdonensis]OWK31439.1 hypothetical protein SPDO_14480 [Sphingomonas dokdonensis]